jgi:hypothetical protein
MAALLLKAAVNKDWPRVQIPPAPPLLHLKTSKGVFFVPEIQ